MCRTSLSSRCGKNPAHVPARTISCVLDVKQHATELLGGVDRLVRRTYRAKVRGILPTAEVTGGEALSTSDAALNCSVYVAGCA